MEKQNIIFEDFIQDRKVKMFMDPEKQGYSVYVQVFTTDNLPFSPADGGKEHIFFDYAKAATDDVAVEGVTGDAYNPITKMYEVTDHTFVVGKVLKNGISEQLATTLMKEAADKIILELSKRIPMPKTMPHPHILTDIQRCEQLLTDQDVKITDLSEATGIPTFTLYNYRKNPAALKRASYARINKLVAKYYDTYFNRNEIERFRFMLINIVGAYLKESKDNQPAYDSAYELYNMCKKSDWHGLARMEEMWKAFYNVQK